MQIHSTCEAGTYMQVFDMGWCYINTVFNKFHLLVRTVGYGNTTIDEGGVHQNVLRKCWKVRHKASIKERLTLVYSST